MKLFSRQSQLRARSVLKHFGIPVKRELNTVLKKTDFPSRMGCLFCAYSVRKGWEI